MKKSRIASLILGLFSVLLVACSNVSNSSSLLSTDNSNTVTSSEIVTSIGSDTSSLIDNPITNIYEGTGDFYFAKWQAESETVYTEVTVENDGSTAVRYVKSGSLDGYCPLVAEIQNMSTSFRYLNITLSGEVGKTVLLRIMDETASNLIIGPDRIISLENGINTYSYDINPERAWMLDAVDSIEFIAEPGLKGALNSGVITIHETWFSSTKPDDSQLVSASPWSGSGAMMVTSLGNETNVSFTGVAKGSWQYISTSIESMDFPTQNTVAFIFENTGATIVYLSIKTVASSNNDDSSSLTWDNIILNAYETKAVSIPLSEAIRRIVIFVSSTNSIPAGTYSGTFKISSYELKYVDPGTLSMWSGTGKFINEKLTGESIFTFSDLSNGNWDQNISAIVGNNYPDYIVVSVTIENLGDISTSFYVKAQNQSGGEVAASGFSLDANTSKVIKLVLNEAIAKMVVFVNAHSYVGEANDLTAGSFRITNPIFSNETPAPTWNGSSKYQVIDLQNGTVKVDYSEITSASWSNIYANVIHQYPETNSVEMSFANNSDSTVYIQVVLTASGGQFAWNQFSMSEGESYDYFKIVDRQITKIELYICSTSSIPSGTYAGSFIMSNPLFANVVSSWKATSSYSQIVSQDFTTFNYSSIANGDWNQNISADINYDFSLFKTISFSLTNKSSQDNFYYVKAYDAEGEITYASFFLGASESKEIVFTTLRQVSTIMIWTNAENYNGEGGEMTSGSLELTEPVFSNLTE